MSEAQRHSAKYSISILKLLKALVNDEDRPIPGILFDPFAGVGSGSVIRQDWQGIELEPEYAAEHPKVTQGNALDLSDYPDGIGCITTSPTYGNRMAGNYTGSFCKTCGGCGAQASAVDPLCPTCKGSGTDAHRRRGYAVDLQRPLHEDNSGLWTFGKNYKDFHRDWLGLIAEVISNTGEGTPGFILNMSDHWKTSHISNEPFQEYVHVCRWWLTTANVFGWKLLEAHSVNTPRNKEGANQHRVPYEQVFLFSL
jgi:hypothetical protein